MYSIETTAVAAATTADMYVHSSAASVEERTKVVES